MFIHPTKWCLCNMILLQIGDLEQDLVWSLLAKPPPAAPQAGPNQPPDSGLFHGTGSRGYTAGVCCLHCLCCLHYLRVCVSVLPLTGKLACLGQASAEFGVLTHKVAAAC